MFMSLRKLYQILCTFQALMLGRPIKNRSTFSFSMHISVQDNDTNSKSLAGKFGISHAYLCPSTTLFELFLNFSYTNQSVTGLSHRK